MAEVSAIGEVSPEQSLHHKLLHAIQLGQPDEAVCLERVGRPPDLLESEPDALGPPHFCQLCVQNQRTLPTPELGGTVLPAAHALFGHLWIEWEWELSHVHVPTHDDGEGPFQPPLADVAPR